MSFPVMNLAAYEAARAKNIPVLGEPIGPVGSFTVGKEYTAKMTVSQLAAIPSDYRPVKGGTLGVVALSFTVVDDEGKDQLNETPFSESQYKQIYAAFQGNVNAEVLFKIKMSENATTKNKQWALARLIVSKLEVPQSSAPAF